MKKEALIHAIAGIAGVAFMTGVLWFGLDMHLPVAHAGKLQASYESLASIDVSERRDLIERGHASYEAPEWVCPYSESELDLLAAIVYAEAGDQGFRGMQLVCDVILNRIDKGWGSSISSVVYQSGQFSPVTDGGLDRAWSRVTQECYEACMQEVRGPRLDYDIQYFSMYYCANGVFAYQYGDHYFGY